MKTTKQTFVIALAMMATLAIGSSAAFGQDKDDNQSADSLTVEQGKTAGNKGQGNTLVGVWETVAPALNDCETGLPAPDSPIIRVLQKFNRDGTMAEENTDPIEGPYRTTAHGIWERTHGRQYRAFYMHYGFAPDKTHIATIKIRSIITLSRDANTFNEKGEVEVLDPQNNDAVLFTGCFNSGERATRLRF
ncbi:MAG: hypothetical protein M3458_24105 [Acidobacteriota bacterium]|nr:hypothetical protein [Acidobacteriota bacterium]